MQLRSLGKDFLLKTAIASAGAAVGWLLFKDRNIVLQFFASGVLSAVALELTGHEEIR